MRFVLVLFVASTLCCAATHGAEVGALPQNFFSESISSLFAAPGSTSPTETKLSFQRRNLLQSRLRQCFWNAGASECEIGEAAVQSLVLKGISGYAKYHHRRYKCMTGGRTKKTCAAMSDCGWLPDGLCIFVDYVGVYPKSPCMKNAYRTHLSGALQRQCLLRTSARACSKLDGCVWSKGSKTCILNASEVFFGGEVPIDFEEQRIKLYEIKSTALLNTTLSNETFVSMDSYWDSFLEWQVPKTECPKGYDQLVCHYVDVYSAVVLPTYFYCFTNAEENEFKPKDCNADPLCEYSGGQCRQKQALTLKAFKKADKQVLLPLIPGSKDRKIAKSGFICSRRTAESECAGNCQWVPTSNRCHPNPEYILKLLVAGVEDSAKDPLCLVFDTIIGTGCSGIGSNITCNANKKCEWYPKSDACFGLPSAIAKTLIKQEPALKKPYKRASKTCGRNKRRKTCVSSRSSGSDDGKVQ